jgi:methylmalonyl-CoA mutase cobalamin-binding subunit
MPDVDDIVELARRGDEDGAAALFDDLCDSCGSVPAAIEQVFVPLARRAQDDGMADTRALARVTHHGGERLWLDAQSSGPGAGGRVVVGCFPGEWHDLAALSLATTLRVEGYDVVRLGASAAAARIGAAAAHDAIAVALSATTPQALPGAPAVIDAVHALGVPVLVGGAVFGRSARRADALGADGWAATPRDAARLLRSWRRARPTLRPRATDYVPLDVDELALVVDSTLRALAHDSAGVPADSAAIVSRRIEWVVIVGEAALVVDDDRLLAETLAWWRARLVALGRPATRVDDVLGAVVATLEPGPLRKILEAHVTSG